MELYMMGMYTCRCFCYSIDEDTEKWNPQEYVESHCESEQEPFSIMEPIPFLLFGEYDSREIGFKLSIKSLTATPVEDQNNFTSSRIKLLDVK